MMKEIQVVNVDLVKQLNGALVFRLIDQYEPISRIQISEISGLAAASVTKITRQLLQAKLIKEVEQQASTGGRRATSIIINRTKFCALAIRLGRTSITLAIINLANKVIFKENYLYRQSQCINTIEQQLIEVIHQALSLAKQKRLIVTASGITSPGLIDRDKQLIHYLPHLKLSKPWHLIEHLQQHFAIDFFIDNDVRALTLAEFYFGKMTTVTNGLFLRIHRGVAAGLIINKQLFHGGPNNVGELGHTQVDPLGKACYCGNFGCLETVINTPKIESTIQELLQQGHQSRYLTEDNCSISEICHAANQGDPLCTAFFERLGSYLAQVLAPNVNLLNPETIILSGKITAAHQVLLPIIQHKLMAITLPQFAQKLNIEISSLDHDDTIGSFALVKEALWYGNLLTRWLN